MRITSPAFKGGEDIPAKYTCSGEGKNLPLKFKNTPSNTKSLVLIMDDPDIPQTVKELMGIPVFDHWVVFNINPKEEEVKEGFEPEGILGENTAGSLGYIAPCPPDRRHRYFIRLYALDSRLELAEGAKRRDLEREMTSHIIEEAELMGLYERK
ncbi:MAG: YbhB/YbcL family Raf kinase inhibitor-like protein [Parcubacteria group bacterium CG11_big_fil_rev_8_21_14_0_20_39_22]|nr:MAG: YbhB/YbcL family Raf kinase inhibitor-like protein [Parcubacteria group bacterium CG11_big_fil_rev_8_21_14_0_20_39_22]